MKMRLTKSRKMILSLVLAVLVLLPLGQSFSHAAGSGVAPVQLDVEFEQNSAREMLNMINDFRTGNQATYNNVNNRGVVDLSGTLTKLLYSSALEEIAMQRAAEIALSYSHTRPNGEMCFTALSRSGEDSCGENIAAGYDTAQSVFIAWREDNLPYEQQGHRRNMLGSYISVGIGHVICGGVHYWTQEFGFATDAAGTAFNGNKSVAIDVDSSWILSAGDARAAGDGITVNTNRTVPLPAAALEISVKGCWPPSTTRTVKVTPAWASGNNAVAKVQNGKLVSVGLGRTALRTTALGKTLSVPVTVSNDQLDGNGWFSKNGSWYYTMPDGKSNAKDWQKIEGAWYYFDLKTGEMYRDGAKATGKDNSVWYLFSHDGSYRSAPGWVSEQKTGKNGSAQTVWYYVNGDGTLRTGWYSEGNSWYYLRPQMVQDGSAVIDGTRYYFDANGVMQTGWRQGAKGEWYYLNAGGAALTGWQELGGVWYYFKANGAMAADEIVDGCYLDPNGAMKTGWVQIGADWYFFGGNGVMLTGWQELGGNWYYFYENGKMAANTTIDGWRVNADGVYIG